VKGIIYFIGGWLGPFDRTDNTYAFNPKKGTWTQLAPMPGPPNSTMACAVESDIIYVMGGYYYSPLNGNFAYDPANNTWTEEMSMDSVEQWVLGALVVSPDPTIVVLDGSNNTPGSPDGNTEGYNAATNTWEWLASDPVLRDQTCVASIGRLVYSAGGWNGSSNVGTNESFNLSKNAWAPRAQMPQAAAFAAGAAYKGRLYCFGGTDNNGNYFGSVQIYQP
jgi:N-acetylneuraminic acid mutarotase